MGQRRNRNVGLKRDKEEAEEGLMKVTLHARSKDIYNDPK